MKSSIREKANAYKGINEIALKGEIVIYGSTYMANFPFYELANKCHLEHAIYNRSIDGLTTEDAETLLQPCVLDIAPRKIFLQLGEADMDTEQVFQHYRSILQTIGKTLKDTKVYLIGVPHLEGLNQKLLSLCDNKHVFFISFASQLSGYTAQFKQLARFFRDNPIHFTEAFTMADL